MPVAPPRRRLTAALAAAAATTLLLTACSGSSDSGTPAANASPGDRNGFAAYADCLRKNGVDLPTNPSGFPGRGQRPSDPAGGGVRPTDGAGRGFGGGMRRPDGVDEATWQKAQQACNGLRPTRGPGTNTGPRRNGAAAAYRNCLHEHGVDGDPASAGSTAAGKAAVQACKVLSPPATPPSSAAPAA